MHRIPRYPLAAGLIAAIILFAALLWPGVSGHVERHEAIRGQAERLHLAESRLRELVIGYRHGISSNYDEGNLWMERIRIGLNALGPDLRDIPELLDPWQRLQQGMDSRETHWNDFKRRNAEVRNALHLFQSEVGRVLQHLHQQQHKSGDDLDDDLIELNKLLVEQALGESGLSAPGQYRLPMTLRRSAETLPLAVQPEFKRLLGLAEVILKESPALADDMQTLVHGHGHSQLMALAETNRVRLLQAETSATRYRLGLLLGLLLLALVLIGLGNRHLASLRRLGEQGAFFKNMTDHLRVGVLAVDDEERIRFANPMAEQLLACHGNGLIGRSMHGDHIHVEADGSSMARERCDVLTRLKQGKVYAGEQYLRRDDGTVIPAFVTTGPWEAAGQRGFITVFQDISARVAEEKDRRLAETVFENSQQGIVVTDASGTILRVNPAYCAMTGYREEALVGANPRLLQSEMQDTAFYRTMWSSLTESGRWQGELRNRRSNGELYTQWINIDAVRTERGDLLYVGIASDISELADARARLSSLAYFDPLTHLPNRILFHDRLSQALAQMHRENKLLALIYADLDNFKSINDTLGHAAGDQLLIEVARRLQQCVRESDTVARLGGDEFALILMDAQGPQEMARLASEIIASLSLPYKVEGYDVTSGASLGITFWPTDGNTPDVLLKYADVAMYRAKESGRNNFQFFTSDMASNVADSMRIEGALRYALDAGELSLFYQPQVTPDGRAVAAEALMRWNSRTLGWIPPNRFIPIAEKSGLITRLGDFALRESCRQCRQWRDDFAADMRVSVNLSAIQFRQEGLLEKVAACLHEFGLPGDALELEITESAVMEDAAQGQATMDALKRLGCRIAIDDFGTGYSSLAYLKRFPVDVLKIDKSFIDGLGSRADDTLVVQAIMVLASSLGLEVVAEGVETLSQLEILKASANGQYFLTQGYFFAPPVPAADFQKHFPIFRQLKLVAG